MPTPLHFRGGLGLVGVAKLCDGFTAVELVYHALWVDLVGRHVTLQRALTAWASPDASGHSRFCAGDSHAATPASAPSHAAAPTGSAAHPAARTDGAGSRLQFAHQDALNLDLLCVQMDRHGVI